jgi:hypothetical protein
MEMLKAMRKCTPGGYVARKRLSNRGIPAGVSYAPDGSVVVIPRQVCIF